MYSFGEKSQKLLSQADPRLQQIFNVVINFMDITILETVRDKEKQDKMVAEGKSKVVYPKSKHNVVPSLAVDAAPYPIDWNKPERFAFMAGLVIAVGAHMGVRIRWGGDWDKDGELSDNRFNDLPHFEIVE